MVQFSFGRFSDPPQHEGTAELCLGLVQKGTEGLSSEKFAEKLEYTGANLLSEMGEEHSVVGIRMLAKYLPELFPVFWDMLCKPAMEEQEFVRLQREMVTALRADKSDPGVLASHHFYNELVGKEHPAGRFHSIESVKRIRFSDVKRFYADFYSPESMVLVVTGNFDTDQFKEQLLPLVQMWRPVGKARLSYGPAVNTSKKAAILVNKPDLTQASIIIGHSAPGEMNPNRNDVALANYVLGAGNFSSRLMTSIRSSGGKTYGISSHIASEKYFGAFQISTATKNNQVSEMLQSILTIFDEFCKNGITEEELENAKRFAIGNMAFQLEGINNIAEKLLWLRFYERSNSYIEKFDEMINRISIKSVNENIKTYFSPENLIIVIVGKKQEIMPQLRSFYPVKSFHFRDKI